MHVCKSKQVGVSIFLNVMVRLCLAQINFELVQEMLSHNKLTTARTQFLTVSIETRHATHASQLFTPKISQPPRVLSEAALCEGEAVPARSLQLLS